MIPDDWIKLSGKMGQLGNQMFQYAALKGIARNRGLDYIVPKHSDAIQDGLGNTLRIECLNHLILKVNTMVL